MSKPHQISVEEVISGSPPKTILASNTGRVSSKRLWLVCQPETVSGRTQYVLSFIFEIRTANGRSDLVETRQIYSVLEEAVRAYNDFNEERE